MTNTAFVLGYHHKMDLIRGARCRRIQRTIPQKLSSEVQTQVQEMLQKGIIQHRQALTHLQC